MGDYRLQVCFIEPLIECQVGWEPLEFQTSEGRVLYSSLMLQPPTEPVHTILDLVETLGLFLSGIVLSALD